MTYYDKINDILTNFLVIPDLSKIVSSYLFTCNNKYIVNLNQKQVINKKFPKEFYESSFGNKFVLCASIPNKKELTDYDLLGEIVCDTHDKEYKNLKILGEYDNVCCGYDIEQFMKKYNSTDEHWCVFLEKIYEMYWAININKKSKLYGHIIFIIPDYRGDFHPTYLCKNILEFENMFYKIIEKIHITEKYSNSRKKKYGTYDLSGDYFDYDGRDYAFEQIEEQQIHILQKKYGYDYRDKKNIEKVNMKK